MISKQVLIAFFVVICTSVFSTASPVPTETEGARLGKQWYGGGGNANAIAIAQANANGGHGRWGREIGHGTRSGKQYYSPNLATQTTNANAGAGGASIATGTSMAGRYWKRSVDSGKLNVRQYYGYGSPNLATQTSNANAGAGSTAIATGTSGYWKRSVDSEGTQLTSDVLRQGKQYYTENGQYYRGREPNTPGTVNASRYFKRSVDSEGTQSTSDVLRQGKQWYGGGGNANAVAIAQANANGGHRWYGK